MVRPCSACSIRSLCLLSLASLFALVACGNRPDPATSPPSPTEPASSALPAASADPGEGGGEGEPHKRARKPFAIHSSCPDVATVAFGEDPKAAAAGKRTVASNSSIDGPRDSEGKQTVWLLDDKGEPLVKVHITRGMKQLEIGRSCRTLDAH